MYDINFFQKSQSIKEKIVKGDFQLDDAGSIEKELENLRSQSPKIFNIETTNYCNMKCVMCARTELMTRDNIWIDDDTFLKVIDQIQPHSSEDLDKFWGFIEREYNSYGNEPSENTFYFRVVSRCIILHGFGEPLLDKKIVDRVKACSDRGLSTYFSCVPANLTVERAEDVMKAGLTVFKFSIDALDDEWQKKIRGKQNNFEAAYRTILDIIDLKEAKGYKTLLVPCMIALSEDEKAQDMHSSFMKLWEGKDVFAYVKSQDNRWLYEEDESIVNRSHYAAQYCEYPWTSMTVMANGSVVPCTQDYDTEMVLGDVNKKNLQTIWNDEPLEQLRRMHITGEFPPGHKCKERCDQKKLYEYLKESGEKSEPSIEKQNKSSQPLASY
jgi:radical SAM protein with 4Fe4S-binding SPASM domain